MSKNIGILMTSRNNYDYMGELWCKKTLEESDGNFFKVLNIDEDSSEEEKEKGKALCDKYENMTYMDREEPGMHHNIDTAIRFFGDSVKYIIWFQHDCWPLQNDFFSILNDMIEDGKLDDFGLVTFNSMAQNMFRGEGEFDKVMKDYNDGKEPLGVLTRCHLEYVETGDYYYCGYKARRIKKPIDKKRFSKPFACSEANFFAQAVNVENYKTHVDINRPFYYFKSWDDISLQFLLHNVYNIAIPYLYVTHRPDTKRKFDLPYLSVKPANKGKSKFHNASGHNPEEWIRIWGWDHQKPKTFENVKKRYKGTLLEKFYKYNYVKYGPLKTFDL